MPELPEVETIRRSLEPKLVGRHITGIELLFAGALKGYRIDDPSQRVLGKRVERLSRRGKYLLFHLSDNLAMVAHLRMTGRLLYVPPHLLTDKHTRVVFSLDNDYQLRFNDQRKFGYLIVVAEDDLGSLPGLRDLGAEPLTQEMNPAHLAQLLAGSGRPIKSFLLDQTRLAGVGNIYADEALFEARIHPLRPANSLTAPEVNSLYRAIVTVLQGGIAHRGTTVRDYVDGEGGAGEFQNLLKVYRKTGQPCPNCGMPIQRNRISGRSSHFCPGCQPG